MYNQLEPHYKNKNIFAREEHYYKQFQNTPRKRLNNHYNNQHIKSNFSPSPVDDVVAVDKTNQHEHKQQHNQYHNKSLTSSLSHNNNNNKQQNRHQHRHLSIPPSTSTVTIINKTNQLPITKSINSLTNVVKHKSTQKIQLSKNLISQAERNEINSHMKGSLLLLENNKNVNKSSLSSSSSLSPLSPSSSANAYYQQQQQQWQHQHQQYNYQHQQQYPLKPNILQQKNNQNFKTNQQQHQQQHQQHLHHQHQQQQQQQLQSRRIKTPVFSPQKIKAISQNKKLLDKLHTITTIPMGKQPQSNLLKNSISSVSKQSNTQYQNIEQQQFIQQKNNPLILSSSSSLVVVVNQKNNQQLKQLHQQQQHITQQQLLSNKYLMPKYHQTKSPTPTIYQQQKQIFIKTNIILKNQMKINQMKKIQKVMLQKIDSIRMVDNDIYHRLDQSYEQQVQRLLNQAKNLLASGESLDRVSLILKKILY